MYMHTYIYKYLNKGMGGSSIVSAAALRAVSTLIGIDLTNEELIHLVSQVEQGIYMYIDMFIYISFLFHGLTFISFFRLLIIVLTTGGGWQDQIGAVYGGFKIGTVSNIILLDLNLTVPLIF
jgi:hypothetical protein